MIAEIPFGSGEYFVKLSSEAAILFVCLHHFGNIDFCIPTSVGARVQRSAARS
jgi:hypothetical protein